MSITEALDSIGIEPRKVMRDGGGEVVVAEVLPGVVCAVTWKPSRPCTYVIDVLTDGERLVAHSPAQLLDSILALQVPAELALDLEQEV
jgi:hypothetical protein